MNNGHLFVTIAAIVASILYIGASALIFYKKKNGVAISIIAWGVSVTIVAYNWIVGGEEPFANIYHILTILSICFVPFYYITKYRLNLTFLHSIFVFGSAIPLIGTLFMEKKISWDKPPALQSIWFVPHVFSYMIAYSLAVVAFILTIVCLAHLKRKIVTENDYPYAIYHITKMAFPFFTLGMFLGAVWAEDAWGVYWSWDIKETWALITWILYILYFHCRAEKSLKKWSYLIQILAFIALTVTFLGVSYFPVMSGGLHSY